MFQPPTDVPLLEPHVMSAQITRTSRRPIVSVTDKRVTRACARTHGIADNEHRMTICG